MNKRIKELIYKKGSLRSQITLLDKFLDSYDIQTENDLDRINLKGRYEKVKLIIDKFETIQDEIDLLKPDSDNLEERERFQNSFYNTISRAEQIISTFEKKCDISGINGQLTPATNTQLRAAINVKLPTLNLPIFDGQYTKWREFSDSFRNMVHNINELSDSQKLCYLKNSLKGEPLEMLCSLETTNLNYVIAWGRLEKRYNNKRRTINNHVQALLDIPSNNKESFQSLRNIINIAQNHIDCLKTFKLPVEQWDAILVPILLSKVDINTSKEWEARLNQEIVNHDRIPTVVEFLDFLNIKQNTLETTFGNKIKSDIKLTTNRKPIALTVSVAHHCILCNGEHLLQSCNTFLKLNTNDRYNKIRDLKACMNCLRRGHFVQDCKYEKRCLKCKRRHHTTLHITTKQDESKERTTDLNPQAQVFVSANLPLYDEMAEVLLSTARVLFVSNDLNDSKEIRAVLDSAAQSHFITKRMQQQLKLKTTRVERRVKGINDGHAVTYEQAKLKIKSRHNNFSVSINCLVIDEIVESLPVRAVKVDQRKIPSHIKLADPLFNKSGPVDLLIGASIFYELLCIGQIKQDNFPILQKTVFGWIVSGELPDVNSEGQGQLCSFLSLNDINKNVEKFWNMDEYKCEKQRYTIEEEYCQSLFATTTTRDEKGKFIVRVPFKRNFRNLIGDSREVARRRFLSLEKRLNANHELKIKYVEFINEYIQLKHMTKIDHPVDPGFYLPHHAVINNSSETTKLRVVFDGSCKLESGLPVNALQCTGPTVQNELFAIIAKFRTYAYVVTADITKMYRQVWVHPADTKYQRIFWRSNPADELLTYELHTVTYGTTSAPFMAIRALIQLANDYELKFPQECKIIRDCFYVDDLLTGADSVEELAIIKINVSNILLSGGFELRKWNSNASTLADVETKKKTDILITDKLCKTLGVFWNPSSDMFMYKLNNIKAQGIVTKRAILAATSQLFDPLGLLAPVVILAKIIIQDLWKISLGWDESVPIEIQTRWLTFKDKLKFIEQYQIPRYAILPNAVQIEIHAFSDASERAYGACIYVKCKNDGGQCTISLLAAKSRVAPIKIVSIPRLELCAAVISAQLVNKFVTILDIRIDKIYYWCDSTIALAWIKSQASRFNTYVANRVTEVQSLTDPTHWHHVRSEENPADLISRGILPDELKLRKLWWQGPEWLSDFQKNDVFNEQIEIEHLPEQKKRVLTFSITMVTDIFEIKSYSSLGRLKRVVAYCIRFITNLKNRGATRKTGQLTTHETKTALTLLIQITQSKCFSREIVDLKHRNTLNAKSKLLSLAPFLDDDGLIRVGGRLSLSEFDFNKKYPIVLPKSNHLTTLIFQDTHLKLLHAGPNLLLNTVREQFWPINGRNIARKTYRSCVKCFRFNANPAYQIMGNLPKQRTQAIHPFNTTGVDYAGPFMLKDKIGRGYKTTKAYIALFICFSTKAIHAELVSDLSTQAFLAALRRFTSRRGKPSHIFCDNGTNFIGAHKELTHLYEFLNAQANEINNLTAEENIQWHFIPPHAPNFGGLWEAGVKSVKYHLKRILSNVIITFEDFYTLLVQVESVLNSRPLTPLTSDPNDLEVLTPAHFLIGRPYTTIPDPSVMEIPENRLSRYQFLQKLNQHFWKRWAKEYISELQQRTKWKQTQVHLKVGTMVLIKDDNLPPARWQLGRVIGLQYGEDGVPRVANVKCTSGVLKRSVSKICALPIESDP